MTVKLGPGVSIVFRKKGLESASVALDQLKALGGMVGEDQGIVVLGPFFALDEELTAVLESLGLKYYGDFFELADSGGPIAEWCGFSLFSK
ncbi:MAG: hypothetical protein GY822_28765 [Deltaproteobacteria bacterium]|nr:hypothetical protein [Deltaproteobacteria bacterium]